MGVEKEFQKVKLFSGFIYREESTYQQAKQKLEALFSPADLESPAFDFDFTAYYNPEMGSPLFRRFVSFGDLIQPERLPDIKLMANAIEIETALDGNRTVNLDPGYLSEANVIIATTKNYYQRVPLAKGIYAHLEYVFMGKKIKTLEWTYPDFKSPGYLDFFQQLKLLYKQNLKELKQTEQETDDR
jgi:hypothetical protein